MKPRRHVGGEVADLVPLGDRYVWLLWCRTMLVLALLAMVRLVPGFHLQPAMQVAAPAWLAVTTLGLVLVRSGRSGAVLAFTVGILGDGVLLAAASRADGGPYGQVIYLTILHAVAVTLLASYRSGMKVAAWHSVLALATVDAASMGAFGRPEPVPVARLCVYLVALWLTVGTTASFSAVNERELRRRRYDSEALRRFSLSLTGLQTPEEIAAALAAFARQELVAQRAAVLVYPTDTLAPAYAAVDDGDGGRVLVAPEWGQGIAEPTGEAGERPAILRGVLDPVRDAALQSVLPNGRNVVVVPFALEQVRGVLAIEHPRWSSQRSSQRVERRMVAAAEQATLHASMTLGRALLTERLRRAAETDGLTGVANRRVLDERLARLEATGAAFAVILVDLDHFKQVNDRHGHQTGDEVLRATAAVLRQHGSPPAMPARYGGEEFAVLLPDAGRDEAVVTAEHIRIAIQQAETPVPVTASLGVAAGPLPGGVAEVVALADAALYRAKKGGRNRTCADGEVPVQPTTAGV